VLHEGIHTKGKSKIIIGPGTGLGCAIITYNNSQGYYNVNPGEGGHTEYTVTNDLELRLRKFAIKWFLENTGEELHRLSTERLTAGPALPLLYEFFVGENPDIKQTLILGEDGIITPELITVGAIKHKDQICLKVLEQFVKNLAVVTGDMAITTLCYSGIYLCGGVAQALREYLVNKESTFIKILSNKGRMSKRLSEIPVYLVVDEIGLEGSEQYGFQAIRYMVKVATKESGEEKIFEPQ
jgi:glucokinase